MSEPKEGPVDGEPEAVNEVRPCPFRKRCPLAHNCDRDELQSWDCSMAKAFLIAS
jgi:hypothetical protein